jgi:hypothetical protein
MVGITISVTLDHTFFAQLCRLAGESGMNPMDYAELALKSHITDYQINYCPECEHEYRGTRCSCKKSELL